jgi:Na+/H+ antiporter NhaC
VADIDVVRKKRSATTMYWILAAVILAMIVWWIAGRSADGSQSGARLAPASLAVAV